MRDWAVADPRLRRAVFASVLTAHMAALAGARHLRAPEPPAATPSVSVRLIVPEAPQVEHPIDESPKPLPMSPTPQPPKPKPKPPPRILTAAPSPAPPPFVAAPAMPPAPDPIAVSDTLPAPEPKPDPVPQQTAARAEPAAASSSSPIYSADYLENPAPLYPALSRRHGEEGRVLLNVYVEADGRPSRVELRRSSGHSRLDQAALAAVRQWRFVPARQGKFAIAASVVVPIQFSLRN